MNEPVVKLALGRGNLLLQAKWPGARYAILITFAGSHRNNLALKVDISYAQTAGFKEPQPRAIQVDNIAERAGAFIQYQSVPYNTC